MRDRPIRAEKVYIRVHRLEGSEKFLMIEVRQPGINDDGFRSRCLGCGPGLCASCDFVHLPAQTDKNFAESLPNVTVGACHERGARPASCSLGKNWSGISLHKESPLLSIGWRRPRAPPCNSDT